MRRLALLLLLAFPLSSFAQLPEWAQSYGSNIPFSRSTHLTGFGMAMLAGAESVALENAKAQAASDLIKKIQVTVSSDMVSISQEIDGKFSSSLTSVVQSVSALQLEGIEYLTAKDDKNFYALAFIKRAELGDAYTQRIKAGLVRLQATLSQAEDTSNPTAAVEKYLATLLRFSELLEWVALVRALTGKSLSSDEIGVPVRSSAMEFLAYREQETRTKVNTLLQKPIASLDDAAANAVQQLQLQGMAIGTIQVLDLTYQDSDFSSVFGAFFARKLDAQLSSAPKRSPESQVVRGSYWERGNAIELVLLAQKTNGEKIGSVSLTFPKTIVPKDIEIKPRNFEQALKDQKVIAEGALVEGGISVEVWTNKGRNLEHVAFQEGEKVELYFRVNQPAFLRLTYLLSTGQQVLLEEKFYIGIDRVNQVVKYPSELVCSPPFGVERLIVTAFSSEPPKPSVKVEKISGEEYEVIAEPLAQSLTKTRGLKKSASAKDLKLGETALTITTMPKLRQ
ncbi:MAG: LPP20 family lipoprotein [Chloroherpetonaceae bacterium]|nr:LPP20 family lipoprotein [Chloroherpetonaceae bacterium]MCS7211635.1 LPP20 family lipoprotein [Chloroherpetonaceae bacterium]MDW8020429.1 LPP20 family lipoprotein [Chloroherpetonaceae bacterium]